MAVKWTIKEDKMIVEYANKYRQNIRFGFNELSTLIGRTNSAIVTRYYNKLNKDGTVHN